MLDALPKLRAWVFRIQLRQLAQDFLGALVAGHGYGGLDLDDLISAGTILGGGWNPLFPQAKLLAGLGSRRNLQHGAAINGRNLNFSAERCFADGHGNGQVNVVAFAMENGVVSSPNDHVEIADRATMGAGIALPGNANALAVPSTRLDADLKRFGFFDGAFSVTGGARCYVFAGAMAARTSGVELHAPAGLRDLASTSAVGTSAGRFGVSLAMAGSAHVAPGNVQPHDAAANCRPEGNVDLVFEIRPWLRFVANRTAAPAAEHARENVLETSTASTATGSAGPAAAAASFEQVGKIEAAKIKICALISATAAGLSAAWETGRIPSSSSSSGASIGVGCSWIDVVGIKPELIVYLPLFGIAQNVVGLGQRLELFFSPLVAGIYIRMVFARQLTKRLTNLLRRRGLLDPKDFVIIFFGCRGHYVM